MEAKNLFLNSLQQVTGIIDQITNADFTRTAANANSQQTVRAQLHQILGEIGKCPSVLGGELLWHIGASYHDDIVDDALKIQVAWNAISGAAGQAAHIANPTHPIKSSMGELTAEEYFALTGSMLVLRTWDLAQTLKISFTLDDDLAEDIYTFLAPMQPVLQQAGILGAPVTLSKGNSTQDRLIALAGRRPRQ